MIHTLRWLVSWKINVPFQYKMGYNGDKVLYIRLLIIIDKRNYNGLGWRFSSERLRMTNDIVTSRPRCLFVQRPRIGKDRGSLSHYASAYTAGWKLYKLTNHHKTYLFISSM